MHVRTGRPSLPLDVRPGDRAFAGVKLTGDALFAVVTDLRAQVLDEHTAPLTDPSPDGVVAAVVEAVERVRAVHPGLAGLGVGLGGLVTGRRLVRVAPHLGWDEPVDLAALLTVATGLATAVDNDVRALTAAEHWFGVARGLHSFALVTVGVGVGAGIVVHDRLVEGVAGAGGAVGHHPVGTAGLCAAGHRGCAQGLLSSGAVAGAVAQALGRPVTFDEALGLARDGAPAAAAVVADAGRALGRLLADLANLVDPELVILSGDGVGLVEAARAELDAELARLRAATAPPPRLMVRPFPFTDWARGAAAVAVQSHVLGPAPAGPA